MSNIVERQTMAGIVERQTMVGKLLERELEIERLRECLKGSDMLAHVRGEQIERLRAAWRWANPHLESLRDLGPEFVAALEHHRRALEGK